jgi:hypothetical protein
MACTSPPALLLLVTSPAEMVEGHVATLTIVRLDKLTCMAQQVLWDRVQRLGYILRKISN